MSKPVLKTIYLEKVHPELMKSRAYKNGHQVPVIEKIVINSGVSAQAEKGVMEETTRGIGIIAGQKPIIIKARRSVSNFKLREGMPIGVKVTLRGKAMYEFMYRLTSVALPGIRDFRGISTRFDGNGNYTLGITDHTIFPEVNIDGSRHTFGMDITFTTTTRDDQEAMELLKLMGMPFRRPSN